LRFSWMTKITCLILPAPVGPSIRNAEMPLVTGTADGDALDAQAAKAKRERISEKRHIMAAASAVRALPPAGLELRTLRARLTWKPHVAGLERLCKMQPERRTFTDWEEKRGVAGCGANKGRTLFVMRGRGRLFGNERQKCVTIVRIVGPSMPGAKQEFAPETVFLRTTCR